MDERRTVIAQALADCPMGKWLAIDEFMHYLIASGYNFEVTRDPWNLYVLDPEYGHLGYSGYDQWIILLGRYLLCLLFEYVATLGLKYI